VNKLFSPWWLLLLAVAGAAALAVVYVGTLSLPFHAHAEELGQMGDFFGGLLNPLVSLLTLFVAISVWQLQREELKLTRDELEQSRLAMEDQAKTAEQQRQEQRFFDLLNVYQRTLDSISHTQARSAGGDARELLTSRGKQAISSWLRKTTLDITAVGSFDTTLLTSKVENTWLSFDAPGMFDHYFRVVFRILSEAEALLGDQHYSYTKLFRAQLSRSELIILAYNFWLDGEGREMIPLAEKYGLLKHLPKGHLRTTLEQELPPHVFGRTRAAELAALRPATTTEAMA
jgi:hypothetical protein